MSPATAASLSTRTAFFGTTRRWIFKTAARSLPYLSPQKSGARLESDAAPLSNQLIDPRALARRQRGQKRRLRRARTAGIGVGFYPRRLRLARLRHCHRG